MEAEKFLVWMGHCITAWSGIDDELFHILRVCLKTDQTLSAIVYGRAPTLDTRLQLVDEIVLAVLPKPARKNGGHDPLITKQWKTIPLRVRDLMPIRNQLAHTAIHPAVSVSVSPTKRIITSEWWETAESYHERWRGRSLPKRLTVKDLQQHRTSVDQLFSSLWQVRADIEEELHE